MRTVLLQMSVIAALAGTADHAGATTADLVFEHGNVHTANPEQSHATGIAIRAGRIALVGSDSDVEALIGAGTQVVDLHGATVLPGLTDSHYHLALVGAREAGFDLAGTTGIEDLRTRLGARVAVAKPGDWITGSGWIEGAWKPAAFPTRFDLDPVSPDNPVFLRRGDLHAGVANSAALRIVGIDRTTPDPPGGVIMRDEQTGEPTGMLLERAQALVMRHIPKPTEADLREQLVLGTQRSIAHCLCQIHNPGGSYAIIGRLRQLYTDGLIKLRVYQAVSGPGPDADRLLQEGPLLRQFDDRFTVRAIKLLIDGSLGSRTAALLEPYLDAPGSGLLRDDLDRIQAMLATALRQGIQVWTHAIGDRANRVVLDLYEQAFRAVPPAERKVQEPRWRIEHAQILDPADLPRFAVLGVIPSMQPSHAITDLHWAESRLGLARLDRTYKWRSLIASGTIVPGGSDAPVESGDPMVEFYAAVARKGLDGFSGPGWHPEEAVTREQALKMLTIWPAEAAFEEDLRGSIEPGKLADLSILSADIMRIPEVEIPKTRCLMTIIGGEIVFRAAE
ncbi:amidohydrolase [Benzoatithermus flavus]|uniref:Amidohydrolase n=1 Tax=Benzoatithermus flavus TaxID=3108223 RepID=A0ABU8XLV6_9PROT